MNPDLVSQMLNQPIAYSTDRSLPGFEPYREVNPAVMVMTVWGPSPDLPRTLDTQLMFIPVDSPAASELGFSGRVLSFSTSLPSWDERQETSAK